MRVEVAVGLGGDGVRVGVAAGGCVGVAVGKEVGVLGSGVALGVGKDGAVGVLTPSGV